MNSWQNILKLLAIVILADDRIYKEEVDTFVNIVLEIKAETSPAILMSRDMIFDWFVDNRADIQRLMREPGLDEAVTELLQSLQTFDRKEAVLDAMLAISISDNEFHEAEQSLISRAAHMWNISTNFEPHQTL